MIVLYIYAAVHNAFIPVYTPFKRPGQSPACKTGIIRMQKKKKEEEKEVYSKNSFS